MRISDWSSDVCSSDLRTLADDEVPHPDQRPLPARAGDPVQRHPHHPAGPVRPVRQLQQPAHQRLRRSHHHAHRRKRAPRRRHPDDHHKEMGLNFIENPWQGSFAVEYLTDLVEEAVYKEFEAISERGGVLGAMDTMYQRGKIQEESLYYEHKKRSEEHTSELQSLMRTTYAVFCLKKKTPRQTSTM